MQQETTSFETGIGDFSRETDERGASCGNHTSSSSQEAAPPCYMGMCPYNGNSNGEMAAAMNALAMQELQDKAGHHADIYSLRVKFAWLAISIALSWIASLLLLLLFKSMGRITPSLVFALSASVSCIVFFVVPSHCRRSKSAADNIANAYPGNNGAGTAQAGTAQAGTAQAETAQGETAQASAAQGETPQNNAGSLRRLQFQHKLVMYDTTRYAAYCGAPTFWLAFVLHHRFQFLLLPWPFEMSDQVAITMATTTTASVLGILFAVMYWLFPKGYKGEQGKQNHDK